MNNFSESKVILASALSDSPPVQLSRTDPESANYRKEAATRWQTSLSGYGQFDHVYWLKV